MRTFFHMALIGWLVLGLCVPAAAQVFFQLDQCGSLQASDGLRIYFDEGATCECGGIINNPTIGCQSLGNMVQAYLVLTNPSANELTRWQCNLRLDGDYSIQSIVHHGGPDITGHIEGDTHHVDFGTPLPLAETHQVLLTMELILPEGTNPYWYQYGLVEFYLAPASGFAQDSPGYFNGEGQFFPCNSLTSNFNGWDYPCLTLNGLGVTEAVPETWDHVKSLYR